MKLSSKQLEGLTKLVKDKDEALLAVGQLEMRKAFFLSESINAENAFQVMRSELQEKYGEDVKVDMQTGEILNASNNLKKS
tara:strand:+ start:1567 stop:1809 length:243 start_codon:yes stop_codon:yes gene_type:complete